MVIYLDTTISLKRSHREKRNSYIENYSKAASNYR